MKTLPCTLLTTNQLLILSHILLIIFLNQKNNVLLLQIFTLLTFPFLPCNNNFPSPMEFLPTPSSWFKDKNWWITPKSKWLDNRVMVCTLESFLLLANKPFSSILNKCWSTPNKWSVYNNNNSCSNNNINNKWCFLNNKSNTVLWWLIKFQFLKLLEWCDLINEIPPSPIIIRLFLSLSFTSLYINHYTYKYIIKMNK